MAEITAKMVAELRARTGAGMMDCKKALVETGGDFDKAVDWLREKGLASAAKKAGRVAADGRVHAIVEEGARHGVLVEINCETDFVAKGEPFINLCNHVAEVILKTKPASMEALNEALGDTVKEAIAKIGENIQVRRFERYEVAEAGRVHAYIHGEGRVGVLIELATATPELAAHPEVESLCHELALQIASMRAQYVKREDVPAHVIEHEKEILKAQAINEGKKPEIAEKMVAGRINKFYQEVCLLEQEWVKDAKKTVGDLVKEVSGKVGGEITVKRFVRYEKGEGIEKRQDDFQEEVMRQAGLK